MSRKENLQFHCQPPIFQLPLCLACTELIVLCAFKPAHCGMLVSWRQKHHDHLNCQNKMSTVASNHIRFLLKAQQIFIQSICLQSDILTYLITGDVIIPSLNFLLVSFSCLYSFVLCFESLQSESSPLCILDVSLLSLLINMNCHEFGHWYFWCIPHPPSFSVESTYPNIHSNTFYFLCAFITI